MCQFCEALQTHRQIDTILKKEDPDLDVRYTAAIVRRIFIKGRTGCRGTSTDYRNRGIGFTMKFCPECGRKLTKKSDIDGPAETT